MEDYNSKHRNNVATINHNKYKNVLLNKKCLVHSMNKIISKDHKKGTYEIKKISLSHLDDKILFQKNWHNGLAIGYQGSQ